MRGTWTGAKTTPILFTWPSRVVAALGVEISELFAEPPASEAPPDQGRPEAEIIPTADRIPQHAPHDTLCNMGQLRERGARKSFTPRNFAQNAAELFLSGWRLSSPDARPATVRFGDGGGEWESNPPRTVCQPLPDLKSGRPTGDASPPCASDWTSDAVGTAFGKLPKKSRRLRLSRRRSPRLSVTL